MAALHFWQGNLDEAKVPTAGLFFKICDYHIMQYYCVWMLWSPTLSAFVSEIRFLFGIMQTLSQSCLHSELKVFGFISIGGEIVHS